MNISEPIPISSTGSNGSIAGGVDPARLRNNTSHASGSSLARMDSGLGSLPQSSSSSSAVAAAGAASAQHGFQNAIPVGSPSESTAFTDSPSKLNMAGLALEPHSVPGSSSQQRQQQQVVPVGFEEGTLRALCDLDCGFPLLMDRIKQSMASCRVSDKLELPL